MVTAHRDDGTELTADRRWPLHRLRKIVLLLVTLGGLLALAALGNKILTQHQALVSAPKNNVQWSLSRAEVELFTLQDAINRALTDGSVTAPDIRNRFDVFSRCIDTLRSGSAYAILRVEPQVDRLLSDIRLALDELALLVDQPDDELRAALPQLLRGLQQIAPETRTLALEGMDLFVATSERNRKDFSNLVMQTGLLALVMIAALLAMLAFVILQSRQARRRSTEIAESNQRYASTVNASLDAIIVADAKGQIVDFNPAAETTFGYSRDAAIGQKMHEIIIPPIHREAHIAGMNRYLRTGVPRVIGARRVALDAMRADGSTFPVELSIGVAGGSDTPLFIGYARDISSRRQTQQELTHARDAALKAAKAKSEFLAVMSHEMRTPLNGVMGILDLLSDTDLTEKQRQYTATAVNSGELLQGHINNVLDITSMEEGVLELRPVSHDIRQLLDEIAEINEPAAAARGNRISVKVEEGLSEVIQDRGRLGQVVMNLVGNAVKFTSKGDITIHARLVGAPNMELELSVTDTGIGMEADDRARIFDAFVMVDPSYQRSSEGTGLGLTISSRLVEFMGGSMGVASAKGEGSRFWLRVPLGDSIDVVAENPRPLIEQFQLPQDFHVLLVEDNDTNRLVAREMLQRIGCRVTEAYDGVAGVEKAAEERFDLIFMDISMPRMDGISATRAIRSGGGPSHAAPIIALTAHAAVEDRADLLDAGMQDILVKPLRDRALRDLLSRIVSDSGGGGDSTFAVSRNQQAHTQLDAGAMDELAKALPPKKFVQRLKGFHAELDQLAREGLGPLDDLDAVANLAHRHAGSAAVFGAQVLQHHLAGIEVAANNGDESLGLLVSAMRADAGAVRVAVEERLTTVTSKAD